MHNPETRKRELNGLTEAYLAIGLKKALVVTYNEQADLKHEGISVEIRPYRAINGLLTPLMKKSK